MIIQILTGELQRLANLDNSFTTFETKAEAIRTSQAAQIETQARLSIHIDQMQTDLYLTQGLLADITSSASGLLATIDETSTKIAQMATISDAVPMFFQWGWLILMIFIIYQFNPKYAGNVAAILSRYFLRLFSRTIDLTQRVFFSLVNSSGVLSNTKQMLSDIIPADTVLIHYASGSQIPLLPLLKVTALIAFAFAIAILYRLSNRFSAATGPTSGSESKLPILLKMISLHRNHPPPQI